MFSKIKSKRTISINNNSFSFCKFPLIFACNFLRRKVTIKSWILVKVIDILLSIIIIILEKTCGYKDILRNYISKMAAEHQHP